MTARTRRGSRKDFAIRTHDVIAIGGSFGAVDAVMRICRELPADLVASIFVVIHVGAAGNDLLAELFAEQSRLRITTAVDGERVEKGRAYVAPADYHLLVVDDVIRLGRGPRENMARPALDPMLRSVGVNYGSRAIGLVLTGMLNDGAAGLADLKRCGGVTVVQSPADSMAAEMPLGALRASDIDYRAPLADIASLLVQLSGEAAGTAHDVPAEIRLEVDIALGRPSTSRELEKLGKPVPLSCPACGGVLSQINRQSPLRFRCQVGHAYTATALEMEKEGAVDEAMRVALRIIEERAVLNEKIAVEAHEAGRPAVAAISENRAKECRLHADTLREALLDIKQV